MAALAPVALGGCDKGLGTFAFVTVSLGDVLGQDPDIRALRSLAHNHGQTSEAVFPSAAKMIFGTKSYIIELGSRTGPFDVIVEGKAADGTVLTRGFGSVGELKVGQNNVPVSMGLACGDVTDCQQVHQCGAACVDAAGNDVSGGGLGFCNTGTTPADGSPCQVDSPTPKICVIQPAGGSLCVPSSCGDNITDTRTEQCDLGGTANNDNAACTAACQSARCGDGLVETDGNVEDCDCGDGTSGSHTNPDCDGQLNGSQKACRGLVGSPARCTIASCGDGEQYLGAKVTLGAKTVLPEDCDDGTNNSWAPDQTCRVDCTLKRCGDGVVDTGEFCDDFKDAYPDQPTHAYTSEVPGSGCQPETDAGIGPPCTRRVAATAAQLRVTGASAGIAVAAGKLDPGTIADDLVIGAPQTSNGGALYVLFGGAAKTGTLNLSGGNPDIVVVPGGDCTTACTLGSAAAIGHVMTSGGDAGLDGNALIVGSNGNNTVYVLRGPIESGSHITLGDRTVGGAPRGGFAILGPGHSVPGVDAGVGDTSGFGWALAIADVDEDGVDDIIVGARNYWAGTHNSTSGAVFVIYGGDWMSTQTTAVDLTPLATNPAAPLPAHVSMITGPAGSHLGMAIAAGDVTGSGHVALIIGAPFDAPNGRANAGSVYVVQGPVAPGSRLDTSAATVVVKGAAAGDHLGISVAAGDLDGGGSDLVIGAYGAGAVYVLAGPVSAGVTDLQTTAPAALMILGASSALGQAVAVADVTGDGALDLIATAPGAYGGDGLVLVWPAGTGHMPASKTYATVDAPGQDPEVAITITGATGAQLGWALCPANAAAAPSAGLLVGASSAAEADFIPGGKLHFH